MRHSGTIRRARFDRERVDALADQPVQRGIDQAMAFDRAPAGECCTDDPHAEVPAALAGMADMQMAFVDHFQRLRLQRGHQPRADVLDARRAHGRVLRNGRTLTSRYTPAATYGSACAHARAASRSSNSATIRLPVNPAGP